MVESKNVLGTLCELLAPDNTKFILQVCGHMFMGSGYTIVIQAIRQKSILESEGKTKYQWANWRN